MEPSSEMPFERRSSATQVGQGRLEGLERPGLRLLRQLLGAEWLQLHGLDDLRRRRSRVEVLSNEEQIAQAPMELRDEHRERRAGLQEPLREPHGWSRVTRAHRIEEGPRGARDGLADERFHVRDHDRAARSVERQLLQLGVGQLRAPSPIDVRLADVTADPLGEEPGGRGLER